MKLLCIITMLLSTVVFADDKKVIVDFSKYQPNRYPADKENKDRDRWHCYRSFRCGEFYKVKREKGNLFLNAKLKARFEPLVIGYSWDPREYPFLSWRWRAITLPLYTDTKREVNADDLVASVLVYAGESDGMFSIFKNAILKGEVGNLLKFGWSNNLPIDMLNPVSYKIKPRSRIFIPSSGKKLNEWETIKVNILEIYRKQYQSAPKIVFGLALSSESDDTNSTSEADYDDIVISKN